MIKAKEKKLKVWDHRKVFRTTKCFSPSTNGYPGGFPLGFLKYLKEMDWWGKKRVYLCAGGVNDPEAIRVDIPEDLMKGAGLMAGILKINAEEAKISMRIPKLP